MGADLALPSGSVVLFALLARFLKSFLFGVAAGDPVTLAAAALALVGISALASWIPARRAARVDPAGALRAVLFRRSPYDKLA